LLVTAVLAAACSAPPIPPASPTSTPGSIEPAKATAVPATVVPTTAPVGTTAPTLAPTAAPTQPAKATAAPASATTASSKPGAFTKADVDKIFPPGRGQDLVFRTCVNCHNWVPIVITQMTKEEWERNAKDHRARVGLNDDDFAYLYQYLTENFNPSRPVPTNIPQDLLDSWTSY
jgi:hypothetical protein